MDIEVDVLISLENKTLRASVAISHEDWAFCPETATSNALKAISVDLDSIGKSKDIKFEWGDIVMDLTSTLDESKFENKSAFVTISLTEESNGGVKDVDLMLRDLYDFFPVLQAGEADCPACESTWLLSSLIPHMNDNHKWSREEIADWLEESDLNIQMKSLA